MAAAAVAVVVAALVVAWRRRTFSWLAVCIVLLLLQPAWRLAWGEIINGSRAASSDCGFGNRGESIFLAATLGAVLVMLIRGDVSKRLFLLRLTVVCWIIHVLVFLLGISQGLSSFLFAVFSADVATQTLGTIEAGAGRISRYTIVLTVCCAFLYILERRRRRVQPSPVTGGIR